jgi:hypothetical protein
MNEVHDEQGPMADAEIEREILEGRKFTLEEAIARMAGPGAMKGASPVAPLHQAEMEIGSWLRNNLVDPAGALVVALHRQVKGSELLLNEFDQPLLALAKYCEQVLGSDYLLEQLVRDADIEWGRVMGERPLFEKVGAACNPDDPYTIASVRESLSEIFQQLAGGKC